MDTIDNIMRLHHAASHAAVQYALLAQVSLRSEQSVQALDDRNETQQALRTALTELASTATEYQQAAPVVAPDVLKDAERLDWLDKNIFNRENLDWITKKVSHTENMWVMFAPVGVQGSARAIIDAAMGGTND